MKRLPLVAVSCGVGMTMSLARAQPPPEEPTPPPPAPDPNWAPPLPAEPPPQKPPAAEQAKPSEVPASPPTSPEPEAPKGTMEIYGFAMLDGGYDFGKIGDPNWQDTARPTKLPSFANQYGRGDRTFMGVRQSRLGVKATLPTDEGEIKTTFEFELFGTGVDEGQTTFRLRHVYGDWKTLRAGQTWSPFMDPDVFPNSIEYWGPNGMVFFRNVQLAWMPVQGDSRVTVALERPGASPDTGIYAGRIELDDVRARFPAPDISAEGRYGGKWGYVELAGILRYIAWDDLGTDGFNLAGNAYGWGLNLSSNIKIAKHVARLQAVYGTGIENYMNDAGADIAPEPRADPIAPLEGEALPVFGMLAFIDLNWSDELTSTAGYSYVWIDNKSGQAPAAFHAGHYALGNILYHPVPQLLFGPEFQFIRRENNSDGFDANDYRIQFSVKYSFSHKLGGE